MRAKRGEWRWILCRGKIVERDAANRPVRMVGTHSDITFRVQAQDELKQEHEDLEAAYRKIAADAGEIRKNYEDLALSRKALQKSEQRYRTIFENTGTATVIIDEDTTIRLANAEFGRLSGYSREEIEGKKKWMEFVVQEDLPRMLAQHRMRRVNHDRALRAYEFGFIPRDGGIRHIHLTIDTIPETRQSVASLTDITPRRAAELSLGRSERLYRDILASIQDIYYRTDRDGYLVLASPSAATMLGYGSVDDLYDRNNADRIWPGPEERQAFLDLVCREGSVTGQDITFRKRDGTPLRIETNAHLYYDEDGSIAGVEGIIRDNAQRSKAGGETRGTGEWFRRIFEDSPLGIVIVLKDRSIRMANRRFCEMLQYGSDELQGKSLADFTCPGQAGQDRDEPVTTGRAEPALFRTEETFRKKDGSTLRASLTGSPVTDDNGKILCTVVLVDDITARKREADELTEREAFLCTLVESMTDAILIVDRQGNALFGNPALARLAGFPSFDAIAGANIGKFLSGESRDLAFRGLSEVLAGHKNVKTTLRVNSRDGTERWIEAVGAAVRFRGQDADLVCIRDITEKHELERRLREMNRKLTLLSTVTRHDVLNKLTIIFGHLTILRERLRDSEALASVTKAAAATESVRKQVEFTRQYEKLGQDSPRWQDVSEIIRETAPPSVVLNMELGHLEVYADPMLPQVFANLFDNSLRHGGKVTEVTVACRRTGADCVVTFADNGTGIPAEEKENVFSKGYGRNTGMGLFLVREILSITGMTVHETGEPGAGARFEITVPAEGFRGRRPSR
jgi:PAS domain S-box-containing protein